MLSRHLPLIATAIVAAVVVSGCTPGGDDAATATESTVAESPSEKAASEEAGPQARWTEVALPAEVMPSSARVAFDSVLAGTGELPHMVAGVTAEPGEPDQVRLWTSADTTDWETVDVPLRDGAHATVAAGVTDGTTTALVGTTWTADEGIRPYALRSDDRDAWDEVTLPEQASERAVDPQAAALNADGALLLLGLDRDGEPVAVRAGDDGDVIELPAPGDDLALRDFAGVAAGGDTVVAIAHVSASRQHSPVTYRSTDGGQTWELADGPPGDAAAVDGIVHAGDGFVATGSVNVSNTLFPAAWSSADGGSWTQEDLPNAAREPDDGWDRWLDAPAADGDEVLAAHGDARRLHSVVMRRDASGSWSIRGQSNDWIAPGIGAIVAPMDDGSALMARSGNNSGIVGVVSPAEALDETLDEAELEELQALEEAGGLSGTWTTSLDTIGANSDDLFWSQLALDGETPALIGNRDVVTTTGGGWSGERQVSKVAFTDETTISAAAWDPPESEDLVTVATASDDTGATAIVGTEAGRNSELDVTDVVGWFRASPDDAWTPAEGLAGPRTEHVNKAFRLSDQWVAVGTDRGGATASVERAAAVWTSTDGVAWTRQEGPFGISAELGSWAEWACGLPGGAGTLVVGGADSDAGDTIPMAWRQTADGWTRVDQPALGDGGGTLFSCAVHEDVTIIRGQYEGADTLWRTTDGEAFERIVLSEHGESYGAVHTLASGLATTGTRTRGGDRGAVVWLSSDGEQWQPVQPPSSRPLHGDKVLDWDGRLVFSTDSGSSGPQVWILENPEEFLSQPEE